MRDPSSRSSFACATSAGLNVARVKTGLDQQKVHAAFDQALGLLVVAVAQLLEGDVAAQGDGFRGGPERAGDETGLSGRRKFVRGLARQLRAANTFSSWVLSASPNSASTIGEP